MYLRAFGDEKERLVSHLKQRVDEEKRERMDLLENKQLWYAVEQTTRKSIHNHTYLFVFLPLLVDWVLHAGVMLTFVAL